MTKQQSWILTDLDAHTIDFEPFKYDFTNLTLFRSVDYQRPFVMHSLHRQTITKLGPAHPLVVILGSSKRNS